jgi:hypothetical protein
MNKIFNGLYDLLDGTFLKWNRLSQTWKIVGSVSYDILELELPDVDFKEIKTMTRFIDKKYFQELAKIRQRTGENPIADQLIMDSLYCRLKFKSVGMYQFQNIFEIISKHDEVNFTLLVSLRRNTLIEQGFDISGINFALYTKVLEEKFKRL